MARFEALAIDFDGVLADTIAAHPKARLSAFEVLGLEATNATHAEAHRHGSHPPAIIGWILQQTGVIKPEADVLTDTAVQAVVAKKNQIYHEIAANGLQPVAGALDFIREASVLYPPDRLAIATTASRNEEVLLFCCSLI